ncbi:hypothetical protein AURDEDRAFT_127187 [Auricularia subglabra TFB-10046 SS5]|nr:hypothetical protein AURDEDRAFT_127187 [Auricularia subglabra TFB-10046 SS5]
MSNPSKPGSKNAIQAVSPHPSQRRSLLSSPRKPITDAYSVHGLFSSLRPNHHSENQVLSGAPPNGSMTGAQFTFGAFGDFLLFEAARISDDIAETVSAIDAFTQALQGVRARIDDAPRVPDSVRNGIEHALATCQTALGRVKRRVDAHYTSITLAHGRRVWKGYWATCAWTILGGKAEAERLKRHLVEQVTVLQTFVSLLHSTGLDEITDALDKQAAIQQANIEHLIASLETLPARVRSEIPFQFFDHKKCAVEPMLKLSWRLSDVPQNFVDFWTEHDFPMNPADIPRRELHKIIYAAPTPGSLIWFELYIHPDPQQFGTPTAVFSPVYISMQHEGEVLLSDALSRAFSASAGWLARTLEKPISQTAPLSGPRSRQQFIHLEFGLAGGLRTSLHTRQYLLDVSDRVHGQEVNTAVLRISGESLSLKPKPGDLTRMLIQVNAQSRAPPASYPFAVGDTVRFVPTMWPGYVRLRAYQFEARIIAVRGRGPTGQYIYLVEPIEQGAAQITVDSGGYVLSLTVRMHAALGRGGLIELFQARAFQLSTARMFQG